MGGEALVEKDVVRRGEVAHRPVGAEQIGEEGLRLRLRGFLEQIVEIIVGVERGVRRGAADLPQIEPVVEERLGEALRFGVVNQAVGLRAQHLGPVQRAAVGECAELGVGR